MTFRRPRAPLGSSATWAIDEFTLDNGATEIIPGGHAWGDHVPSERHTCIYKIAMPAGSVLIVLIRSGPPNRVNRN